MQYKKLLDDSPFSSPALVTRFGYKTGVEPEDEWHVNFNHPDEQDWWNPIDVIEQITMPVLAFFAEKDTQADPVQGAQAYQEALERAGPPNFRVEFIMGIDHNIILSETGCLDERDRRSQSGWTNYAPEYLDILEKWLKELRH